MPIELNTYIMRSGDLLSTIVDKEIVILNTARNNYIELDEVGLRIWELLENPIRVDKLRDQLSREFEATPEQIIADVMPFLVDLDKEGLINLSDRQQA